MSYLTEWVTNIIIFILLATIIDLLLPNSSLRKYTKMVTGLLLIMIILSPIFQFFHEDIEEVLQSINREGYASEEDIKNQIDFKKKEIQASTHAYILEQMAVQLEEMVKEELMTQFEVEIEKLVVDAENVEELVQEGTFDSVFVSLKQVEHTGDDAAVEVVEIVQVESGHDQERAFTQSKDATAIKSFLSEAWSLDAERIEVVIERGNEG